MVMMFQSYWQKIVWFECKPSIYYYSWTPYSFFFFLIFVMIRNNVITVHVTFLFCRNISELYVSIFIVLYPDCIAVVLSKCIQIGHLYIYWNVSGLSVCLSLELYPQCQPKKKRSRYHNYIIAKQRQNKTMTHISQ
jgi:hypothetical protein